ncbi:unnamed protein product [Scytosiphon promiscuus]
MIAGVGLQGFGRLALAKLYIKTEAVINEAASAAATDAAETASTPGANSSGSGRRHIDGARGGSFGGGSDAIAAGRGERDGGDLNGVLKLNGVSSSIAAGVGWGFIHAVIMVGTALSKHMGPGAAFSSSCPHVPSVVVSALSAQAFVMLDLLFMAAAFASARSGDAGLMCYSFGLHFIAALTTAFNFIGGGCAISLPLLYGVVVFSAITLARYGPLKFAMRRLER